SRGSAVSCELRMTSSAWISGESSGPNAAWMPPCAFAELHACNVVFVAMATQAPACTADVAAASPEAPLPITSPSKEPSRHTERILAQILISVISLSYWAGRRTGRPLSIAKRLHSPAHGDPGRDRQADLHHGRTRGHARRGGRAHERAERRVGGRQGLRTPHRHPHRARHAPRHGGSGAHERRPRASVD